ncbi:MAG: MarR family winged helix-turn-helix transcriptional regulator [Eubacteriales bacterium]|nr:MarR family winged helix-turn-helix transcriptional regulator [Eubacteriales bacterium]
MDFQSLGKRFMLLHLLRRRMIHDINSEKEIVPGQYPLLNYLSKNPGASQQDLANMLFVSPASVAQSAKRLQNAGMLEKTIDPVNLRKNRLCVTPAGQEAVEAFQALSDQIDRRTFLGFSELEQAMLLDFLNRMILNLSSEDDLAMLQSLKSQGEANTPCHN